MLNIPIRDWRNQRVWVIGASSGIGEAVAQQLLEAGARVILSARRTDLMIRAAGHNPAACIVPMNVMEQTEWQSAFQQIQAQLGGVDHIIFCAAEYRPERIWEVDPETALRILKINLASVYTGLAIVLPAMLERGTGSIAIVASVAGYMGLPNASVYGPSKAALINLAEILYGDLHGRGINVYLINPGFVDTELTQKNSFYMPALQTARQAAVSILRGMARGQFEIHFPRRFTQILKLVRLLPYSWRFFLFKRFIL